jgi:nitrate/TMAO reductase-like tetraheme cytochrome c subunit
MDKHYQRSKLLFLLFTGCIGLALFIVSSYQLYDYTESTAFCGTVCHDVMYPEYTTYQDSPHSRVRCADCHVGPGANYLIESKIAGIPMIWGTISGNHPRPIESPVDNLRPARDTCQNCHRPEKFSGSLVKNISNYKADEKNTETDSTIVLNVGGGNVDSPSGIHWHVASQVTYLPLDEKRLNISEVWFTDSTGNSINYIDPDSLNQITPSLLNSGKRVMDCIDCHNRATHIFNSPEALIDTALTQGTIDKTLPFIKREALKILVPINSSLDEANKKIDTIVSFYQLNYPQVYADKKSQINEMVTGLKEIARLTTFPDMKVDWTTHPDHSAHQSSPGCFRCHGKLVATNGPNAGKVISSNCNLCHQNITPGAAAAPNIPHVLDGRQDCLSCHGPKGQIPVPPTHSGRSNAVCASCHSAAVQPLLTFNHPITGITDCLQCHGPAAPVPYPSNHAGRTNISCLECHVSKPVPAAIIPHNISGGLANCITCHGPSGSSPYPSSHKGWTDNTCSLCHTTGNIKAPDISHPVAGISNCLQCHGAGGVRPVPADHAGRESQDCGVCHASNQTGAPFVPHKTVGLEDCLKCHSALSGLPVPTSHNGRTNDGCLVCHVSIPSGAPVVPHKSDGASDCLRCHSISAVFPYPANHKGTTNDICLVCHDINLKSAPDIAHPTSGLTNCLSCHESGGLSLPNSHDRYTNEMCSLCHNTGSNNAPRVTHPISGLSDCKSCHGNLLNLPIPDSHEGFANSVCARCHTQGTQTAPTIPHTLTGRSACLDCHSSGSVAILGSHKGLTNTTCALCHTGGKGPSIPHSISGASSCTSCHGVANFATLPSSHSGRANSTCSNCHSVASSAPTLANLTGAPAAAHSYDTSHTNCVNCHGPGKSLAYPSNHSGLTTNTTCQLCHVPGSSGGSAPSIPHSVSGASSCTSCHGAVSFLTLPASHSGRTNSSCTTCHSVASSAQTLPNLTDAPAMGHEYSSEYTNCLNCHAATTRRPSPSNHRGFVNTTCRLCHVPGND